MNYIEHLLSQEQKRQDQTIRLIASENYTSSTILKALGSCLTNKYSEGYPYKRYYQGQDYIDPLETYVIDQAKQVFQAQYANVQAYSGSPANMAVYAALLRPGDTIMGLSLQAGGHLTHGSSVSISGKWFHSISYGLDPESYTIDYDKLEQLAHTHHPKVIISGHSAYPRTIDFARIGHIAKQVGAWHVADISHISGLVITGEHPHPFPHADIIVTTTHKLLRGPRGALILSNEEPIAKAIDKAVFPGLQGGPHMNNIAGIGLALEEAQTEAYTNYVAQVKNNAQALAQALQNHGFSLISGRTENHLLLIDLRETSMNGAQLSSLLNQAYIETNKNALPFDETPPHKANGIRLGTPAVTTQGMQEPDMKRIAQYIYDIYNGSSPEDIRSQVLDHLNQNRL